jgi:hypothetical protein
MNRKRSTIRTAREITANSGEIEWRNSENEALEWAVLNAASGELGLELMQAHKRRTTHFHAPPEFRGGCWE